MRRRQHVSAEIFAEADIQYPMQFIFDAPVLADRRVQLRSIGLEAGDVVTDFAFGLPVAL